MRNVRNRGFTYCGTAEHSSVLACGFREVRDATVVWIVDGRRVTVHESGLVGLLGLTTCGVRGVGQVAKLLGARAEMRTRRRRCGRERGVEVTVREQQGRRMKYESGEGEMEICDMHTANTLSHACARCPFVAQRKCACEKRVCVMM